MKTMNDIHKISIPGLDRSYCERCNKMICSEAELERLSQLSAGFLGDVEKKGVQKIPDLKKLKGVHKTKALEDYKRLLIKSYISDRNNCMPKEI